MNSGVVHSQGRVTTMENRFSINVLIYNDLEELARLVASVPEDVLIHVFDGRYEDFDGDLDFTPEARDFCRSVKNLRYHRPPDDRLPFGDSDISPSYRDSVHKKACWAYYEVLPQDQWTIHMDADERLIYLDRSFFDRVEDDVIYSPRIFIQRDPSEISEETTAVISCTMRIFKPRYWTFWVDDLPIPRHQCKRGLGSKETKKIHQDVNQWEFRRETQSVIIENLGNRRPKDYLRKRREQLESFHG